MEPPAPVTRMLCWLRDARLAAVGDGRGGLCRKAYQSISAGLAPGGRGEFTPQYRRLLVGYGSAVLASCGWVKEWECWPDEEELTLGDELRCKLRWDLRDCCIHRVVAIVGGNGSHACFSK